MMKFRREASYSLSSNHQTLSMQVVIVFWVFVAAAGAAILETVFQRSGPVSGAGGRNSRIHCAASCAREKACSGFVTRDDGVCIFRTDPSPPNTDHYQQVEMQDVSLVLSYIISLRSYAQNLPHKTFLMGILYIIHTDRLK